MTTDVVTLETLSSWLDTFAIEVLARRDELDTLDAATGDGEHGSNLGQGMDAVRRLLRDRTFDDVQEMFECVGMAVVNSVGGASGALYGTLFLRFSDSGAGRTSLSLDLVTQGFASGMAGIMELGRCAPGDKTLLDALHPGVAALTAAQGHPLASALADAAQAAGEGRDGTEHMQARRGRGSYLGERSLGHVDAGATSMALLFRSLSRVVEG